jgi:putative transposase
MPDYRRAWHPGGTYFFTVNLLQRQGNDLLIRHIELLRAVVYPANWAGGNEDELRYGD